ncbi:hypothetical protein RJ639_022503 [Escallonia herrerae]|uniref:TF-B3 domain-containing protein n=1 Tax=Escallonia herrerae TaxID=1293975 RepID=A0AA89AGP0_9ASTE|nr:hypothetical protein RJ639_022503 [Escallonia herrerae]
MSLHLFKSMDLSKWSLAFLKALNFSPWIQMEPKSSLSLIFSLLTSIFDLVLQSIPINFMREYLTKKLSNVDATLQVSDRRGCLVKCTISANNAKFSTGWKQFATDNNLAVGDVCLFELIDDIKKVLKVVIFRAEKDA